MAGKVRKVLGTGLVALLFAAPAMAAPRPEATSGVSSLQALERAQALVRESRSFGPTMAGRLGPRDLTHVMRDLALAVEGLEGSDRDAAERLLARPTAEPQAAFGYDSVALDHKVCDPLFCFHWVTGTSDAPPDADDDSDGVPNQVEATAQVFNEVYAAEILVMGYRPPKPDSNGIIDVYLADLGAQGLYGGCIPEYKLGYRYSDLAGYCYVDDDFSAAQFPSINGLPALQVTAAHEFFHLVQFAYDWEEDLWLMEGTAAWIEDEVYDDINDNYQYLEESALTLPRRALDNAGGRKRLAIYGSFLFYRYLSENFGPAIIKDVWERADGSPLSPDDYSLEAIENVVNAQGLDFASFFADFTGGNNFLELNYEEGAGYLAAVGPVAANSIDLTADFPSVVNEYRLKHLSSVTRAYSPGVGTTATSTLKLKLRLPRLDTGAAATVQVVDAGGTVVSYPVVLDAFGDGGLTIPFGNGSVVAAYVTLTNTSTHMHKCNSGTALSCAGYAIDDDRTYKVKATALP